MMKLQQQIQESISLKKKVLEDEALMHALEKSILEIFQCFSQGRKVLFCGNGGSAADAQHLSAELAGRFYLDREPLAAEALQVNSSFVTAVANDYSFDYVYERMLRAMGKPGDILVALSTSGNSANIVNALQAARETGIFTIGLTGADGGQMNHCCDLLLKVPSEDTPRIQEVHILLGHIICENVEELLFGQKQEP